MGVDVRAPSGEYIWTPAIVVMPKGGELEVELFNDDPYIHHAAILPSNGDKQFVNLPSTRGEGPSSPSTGRATTGSAARWATTSGGACSGSSSSRATSPRTPDSTGPGKPDHEETVGARI